MARFYTNPQAYAVRAICNRAIANTMIAKKHSPSSTHHEFDTDLAFFSGQKKEAEDALKGKKEQAKATQEQQQSTAEQAEGLKRRVEQSFKSVPKPQGLTDEQIIAKAREGISDGTKDPELVRKQLKSWGLNLD